MSGDAPKGLFDRLPEGIFRPLASPNRRQTWDALVRLYDELFTESVAPPMQGYVYGHVVEPIERALRESSWSWYDEVSGEEDRATPDKVRAHALLTRLIECGWLIERRRGPRKLVDMSASARQLFDMLREFAESGPQLVSGRVQMIASSIRDVRNNPSEYADSFREAARESERLAKKLRMTGSQVTELMDEMRRQETPAKYVKAFFTEYIETIYIGDYHELHTRNHPLRHSHTIYATVRELQEDPEAYQALLERYRETRSGRGRMPEAELDADFRRFSIFARIDDHLARLNQVVQSAHQQALAYFNYQRRIQGNFDAKITASIQRVASLAKDASLPWAFAPGEAFNERRLKPPPRKKAPREPSLIDDTPLTPRELALDRLRQIMDDNRDVSPARVADKLDTWLGERREMANDELSIRNISDLCVTLMLTTYALTEQGTPDGDEGESLLPGFSLTIVGDEQVGNDYFTAPKVIIERTGD